MDTPESVKKTNPPALDGLGPIWCGGCVAYMGNKIGGVCRGGPPTPIAVGLQQDLAGRVSPAMKTYWAMVGVGDWCFAFRRADAERTLADPPAIAKPDSIVIGDGGRA